MRVLSERMLGDRVDKWARAIICEVILAEEYTGVPVPIFWCKGRGLGATLFWDPYNNQWRYAAGALESGQSLLSLLVEAIKDIERQDTVWIKSVRYTPDLGAVCVVYEFVDWRGRDQVSAVVVDKEAAIR